MVGRRAPARVRPRQMVVIRVLPVRRLTAQWQGRGRRNRSGNLREASRRSPHSKKTRAPSSRTRSGPPTARASTIHWSMVSNRRTEVDLRPLSRRGPVRRAEVTGKGEDPPRPISPGRLRFEAIPRLRDGDDLGRGVVVGGGAEMGGKRRSGEVREAARPGRRGSAPGDWRPGRHESSLARPGREPAPTLSAEDLNPGRSAPAEGRRTSAIAGGG